MEIKCNLFSTSRSKIQKQQFGYEEIINEWREAAKSKMCCKKRKESFLRFLKIFTYKSWFKCNVTKCITGDRWLFLSHVPYGNVSSKISILCIECIEIFIFKLNHVDYSFWKSLLHV